MLHVKDDVTLSSDCALRYQVQHARIAQNLKDIKKKRKKKKERKGDLSNVNCHLTLTTTIPPGPSSRSGVERELNQRVLLLQKPLHSCWQAVAGQQKQKATERD